MAKRKKKTTELDWVLVGKSDLEYPCEDYLEKVMVDGSWLYRYMFTDDSGKTSVSIAFKGDAEDDG